MSPKPSLPCAADVVLERALEAETGGNTRFTAGAIRWNNHAQEFGAWWLWPSFAFQSYPGGAVHIWAWTPIDVGNTHIAVDWFFPSADLKDWERELVRHDATTTFAEDIPLVESAQNGLAS